MRVRHLLIGLGLLALVPASATAAWAPSTRISGPGAAVTASPDVAAASGRALAAWVGGAQTGGVEAAWRSSSTARWHRPRRLSGRGARDPKVAMNDRGDAVVAWVNGSLILAAVRRGPEGAWSRARVVQVEGGVQEALVAIDAAGRPTIMWSERRGDGFVVRLVVRPSALRGWESRPAEIATAGPTPPALALSPGAGALVAWAQDGGTRTARTVNGAFEAPVEISSESSLSVGIALGPSGLGLAAWGTSLPGGTSVVIGADRSAAGTGWGAPEDLGLGEGPRVAINDRGDAVVAWSLAAPGAPQGIEAGTRRGHGPWQASTVVARRDCACVLRVGAVSVGRRGLALVSWRRDDGGTAGAGGVAASQAGGTEWDRAALTAGDTLSAPAVAADGVQGLAVWAGEGGAAGIWAKVSR